MKWTALVTIAVSSGLTVPAVAQPRHDICADIGAELHFGISSFGAADGWLEEAHRDYGIPWKFVYIYLLGAGGSDVPSWMRLKVELARSVGAIPMITFYQLLGVGREGGLTGSEPQIVQETVQNPALMRTYFDNMVFALETLSDIGGPMIVQVEPDSWGFMMWAFGSPNDDATTVPVEVDGSGHPDVAGFPDHAGGLGQALLALRDRYAPDVRMGWHASNFRAGHEPEATTSFYSSMGDWDLLVTENPHNEDEDTRWWDPWSEEKLTTNLHWFETVTSTTGLPLVLWQMPIGTTDWHMIEIPGDNSVIARYVDAGVVGIALSHRGEYGMDPDGFRATEGVIGTPPPAGHPAGGTAADMRTRVARYVESPYVFPSDTICGGDTPRPTSDGGTTPRPDGGATPRPDGGSDSDSGTTGGRDGATDPPGGTTEGGCGCRVASARPRRLPATIGSFLFALLVMRRWRARRDS